MLQNNPELKSKIDQLWNKFWSGGISNPLTAIEQITYATHPQSLSPRGLYLFHPFHPQYLPDLTGGAGTGAGGNRGTTRKDYQKKPKTPFCSY